MSVTWEDFWLSGWPPIVVGAPSASATAGSIPPSVEVLVAPAAASASASSVAPGVEVLVAPAPASATASAPAPLPTIQVAETAAAATASGVIPTPAIDVPYYTNVITNPSFESNNSNWTNTGTVNFSTFARQTGWSDSGTAALRCTSPLLGVNAFSQILSDPFPTIAGSVWSARAVVNCLTLTGTGRVGMTIAFFNSAGAFVGQTFAPNVTTTGISTFVINGAVAPANSAQAKINLAVNGGASGGSGDVYFDSILLTQSATAPTYFDGSSPGAAWLGTSNNSVSYLGINSLANGSALAPVPAISIQESAASATAALPAPIPEVRLLSTTASATASAPIPVVNETVIDSPPGTATASAPVPLPEVRVIPASAVATASAPVPGVKIDALSPAASASASAPSPGVVVAVSPSAASATASSPTPAVSLATSPPAASASAQAPAPVPEVDVSGQPLASATGPLPTPAITIAPPVASASASAPPPDVFAGQGVAPPAGSATASAPVPGIAIDSTVSVPAGEATASIDPPTVTGSQPPPPPPEPVLVGGSGGFGGAIPMGGFLEHNEEEPEDNHLLIKARPSLGLATTRQPSLFIIDGLSIGHDEQEDEELVLLALTHFGMV